MADRIAHRYSGRGTPCDDLMQVARMGLVKAVVRFDRTRESEFLSFAVPTIMGEGRRYFRDSGWAVRVPRRLKEIHAQIISVTNELSHTPSELATELGIHRQEVVEALTAGKCYSATSMDAFRPSGGERDGLVIHVSGLLARTLAHLRGELLTP